MKMSQCFAVECQYPKEGTGRVKDTAAVYASGPARLTNVVVSASTQASVSTASGQLFTGRLVTVTTSTERWKFGVCRMLCEMLGVPQLICADVGRADAHTSTRAARAGAM